MDRSDLNTLTLQELRKKAEALGVKQASSLTQNDLIDKIIAAQKSAKNDAESAKSADSANTKSAKEADVKDTDSSDSVKTDNVAKADAKDSKAVAKNAKADDKDDVDLDDDDEDIDGDDDDDDEDIDDDDAAADDDDKTASDKSTKRSKKAKKSKKTAKVEDEVAVEEPAPVEPDSIFIDHGAILPEYVPGTCLYALVRDPGTLFVYWNATFESNNGWILTAYDAAGHELQSFTTPARRNGRGYFRVPTARVARVTLSIIHEYGNSEMKLESKIRIAQQLGIAQPAPAVDERWVDVQNHEVIYEAPAPGRAPAFQEVYAGMNTNAMTNGGFDRAVESQNAPVSINGSTSSRFGSLNAPGSSDILASSGSLVRR